MSNIVVRPLTPSPCSHLHSDGREQAHTWGEPETDELAMEWPVESNLGLSVRLSALVPD